MTSDGVRAFVDLAGLGPGRYNLRIQVEPAESFGITSIEPATVTVRSVTIEVQTGTLSHPQHLTPRHTAMPDFSAPMAFEARPAFTRSITRPLRVWAPPSFAPCARRPRPRSRGGTAPLRFLVGRDTRESGEWIERELARGVHSEGAAITTAGVIPTPAIAYVTRAMAFDAGIVISASHNPFEDNGIKVFSGRGEKFTETLERQVEAIIGDSTWQVPPGGASPVERTDVVDAYIGHTRLAFPES